MVLEESHKKIHEKSLKLDSCIHDQSVYLIIACEKSHPLLPARVVFYEKNVCDCTWHRAWLWLELFASTVAIFLSWIYYLFSYVFSSETPYLYFEKAIRLSREILVFRVIGDLKVNQGFISDESHAFAPFQTKINPSFVLHFVLWLAYLIDSSEAIKVGGKQKPYKMWQAGISLAALPLANSLTGFGR